MKIAISGSRTFEDPDLVIGVVNELLSNGHTILVGDAPRGVDLFVRESRPPDPTIRVFKANWDRFGKAAGAIRNNEMLAEAEGFIAIFAPGKRTPGTSHALTTAERLELPRRIWDGERWLRYAGNITRTTPLRDATRSKPPTYWACTSCGAETPNKPAAERMLIDPRFGRRHCRDCKKLTIWRLID